MADTKSSSRYGDFVSPHPGSQRMPQWDAGPLPDPPRFQWRYLAAMIGPGLVMGGSAIGGGEWLTGPLTTARYGGALLWLATLSILSQVLYNIEISRYTLYSGEPIFTAKFRTLPGPRFWLLVYLVLDFGSFFPYLASNAATPLFMVLEGRVPKADDVNSVVSVLGMTLTDRIFLRWLGYAIFLGCLLPLVFGGKIYNSIKVVMVFKIVTVLGFLLLLAVFFSNASTWKEIFTGFFRFGDVPVVSSEDKNGNGQLDPGEDWDGDGHLDGVEERYKETVDTNGDGKPDAFADQDGDGKPDKFKDVDGDGRRDGDNIENFFGYWWRNGTFPTVDFTMLGILCAMAAISGNGGLTNTPISNFTRDQGWGMGYHVGAIPSVVGGHEIKLSHVGMVFQPNAENLPKWKGWYRHLTRDQLYMWMPACFIGLALPSMLSVQFLPRGTETDSWTAAGMTAGNVGNAVAEATGPTMGQISFYMTLFCGFLVLATSMVSTADGVVRRWVDVCWTALPSLRKLETHRIRHVFFGMLCAYALFGMIVLVVVPNPKAMLVMSTNIYNYALGFSCLHSLVANLVLLPKELRPRWPIRILMVLAGGFFLAIAGLTTYVELHRLLGG